MTDSGRVSTDARVAPGLDLEGFPRSVISPSLSVNGRELQPDSMRPDGTLRYIMSWDAGRDVVLMPITATAPQVDGVSASPPAIEWFGLRRAGPDLIRLERGAELLLPVVAVGGISRPPPSLRQWFLTLTSDDRSFRLSADGEPPNPIPVPPQWIPEGDTVQVRLIFTQSATLMDPPGDYLGVVTTDTWLFWTLVLD